MTVYFLDISALVKRYHREPGSEAAILSLLTMGGWLAMKYTILLTEKAEGGIHVSIPALPGCTLEAGTREGAVRLAREAIAALMSQSEVLQVEIP